MNRATPQTGSEPRAGSVPHAADGVSRADGALRPVPAEPGRTETHLAGPPPRAFRSHGCP